MSELLRAEKEAERQRARARVCRREGSQPSEMTGEPFPESVEEPASPLLRLLLQEPAEAPSTRLRWRDHDWHRLRALGAPVLIVSLALLLGPSSLPRLGRLGPTLATPATRDVDTSAIHTAKTAMRSVVVADETAVLFRIQVGAFANPSNAERLVERLRSEGFLVVSRTEGTTQRTLWAVRVGVYATAGMAEDARAELVKRGYVGLVVRER
jgi:SPOR domain